MKKRLVVGISGGSGIPLATELLSQLQKIEEIETHLVYTRGAKITAAQELELSMGKIPEVSGWRKLSGGLFVSCRGGEFCTAGRFLPALPQSVVYYKNGQENGLQKSSWKGGI